LKDNLDPSVIDIFGNKVRVRTCGFCWEGGKLLLANHYGLYHHDFWAPPGGGWEFGQWASGNLAREFREETGLDVEVGDFRLVCEFIQAPLHAIELFFEVRKTGGQLSTGTDPEMGNESQVISEVKFLSCAEIDALPLEHKHGLFKLAKTAEKVGDLKGYLKI
jgi:8-oxo-dGTP diphosphatase